MRTFSKISAAILALFLMTQLSACAPFSGGEQSAGEALMCTQNLQTFANLSANANTQKITIDQNIDSYIVEFEANSNIDLEPSGNAVHEYEVSGIKLKNISLNTYSLELTGNEIEKYELIQRLEKHRTIKFIEPDYPVYQIPDEYAEEDATAAVPGSSQWAHQNVQSAYAWKLTTGSDRLVVAVVDSGIDYTHIDLKNNIWSNADEVADNGIDDDHNGYVDDIRGWNYVKGNNNPITTSSSNHGTHVAGIIGATGAGSRGIYGQAPHVRLMPLKFIGDTGTGASSHAIRAIDYAVSKKVFAINNSWGSNSKSQALEAAIKRAERAGILFIVSAGNGSNGVGYDISKRNYYPAGYTASNIIRVAATKSDNTLTKFSNFSQAMVDVAAPGYSILSTVTGNKYMKMSGTSMAAPLVTGLAVLVKAANPALNFSQVKAIISSTVDPVITLKNKISSGGRVNARKAVAMAANVSSDFNCY